MTCSEYATQKGEAFFQVRLSGRDGRGRLLTLDGDRRSPSINGPSDFEQRVRGVILRLRKGEVATYGEVAEEAGFPGAARAVGNVLARGDRLPWWRVVTSTGRLVAGHEVQQSRRLRREGVTIVDGRVRGTDR